MFSRRDLAWLVAVAVCLAATLGWSLSRTALPRADFTFCNGTEVKSLDPSLVTGQPEGRLAWALFEGLVRWDPKTLEPQPAGAASWEISDDLRVYTFHLRPEAKWSDGTPVTAHDYAYSFRRFLDPRSAAEYSFQAWYLKNGKRYSQAAAGIRPGDPVEVELNLPTTAVNTARGEVLRGRLLRIDDARGRELNRDQLDELAERAKVDRQRWVYTVDVGGRERRFRYADDATAADQSPPEGTRWCRQILLDFREVGVEAVDDLTLRLTLANPTSYWLQLLGFYPLSPVNQACVEKYGSPQWTYAEHMVCNGPFRQQFRRYRDRTRLVRNEHYWDRAHVALETIDVLAVESVPTMLNLFLTGEADWIHEAPPNALRVMLKQDPPRDDLNPYPMLNTYFYLLNVQRPPLDDVRVRRALSMAVDRDEICTKILAAGERPALSVVPPGLPGYDPPQTPGFNVDAARKLLAEAGYPGGRGFPRLELTYNTHEGHQLIAEVVRKQWERHLGIVIKTRNEEWGSYMASQRQSRFDICRKGWIGDYADPNTYLDLFVTGGRQNNTNWGRPEYDALIARAGSETAATARLAHLHDAEALLMDELPIIPVYFYVSKNMVKPYVRGFYNNLSDYHPLWSLHLDRKGKTPSDFLPGAR